MKGKTTDIDGKEVVEGDTVRVLSIAPGIIGKLNDEEIEDVKSMLGGNKLFSINSVKSSPPVFPHSFFAVSMALWLGSTIPATISSKNINDLPTRSVTSLSSKVAGLRVPSKSRLV